MAETRNITYEAERIPEIEDAVDAMHNKTLATRTEDGEFEEYETGEWFSYEVGETEDIDGETLYHHRIYFSEVPGEYEYRLTAHVLSELAERGFVVNNVNFEDEFYHVMHRSWIERRFPEGAGSPGDVFEREDSGGPSSGFQVDDVLK